MRTPIPAFLVLALLVGTVSYAFAQDRVSVDVVMRESTELVLQQSGSVSGTETAPVFGGDLGARAKHASYSLLLPGWSQLRSGHNYRAAFFLTAEAAIWTSFAVFKVQGNSREDTYQDYATQFAEISSGDRDDDYWRTVGNYRSSEEYNEERRRDLRIGLDPEGPEYDGSDAWRWQSESRYDEYNDLRRDANSAYDNADFVIVLALVNRLVAFVDALRSGPPGLDETGSSPQHILNAGDFGMDVQIGPDWSGGVASSFTLSREF